MQIESVVKIARMYFIGGVNRCPLIVNREGVSVSGCGIEL